MLKINPHLHKVTVILLGIDEEDVGPIPEPTERHVRDQFGMCISTVNSITGEVTDEMFNSSGRKL